MDAAKYIASPTFKPPALKSVSSILFDKAYGRIWKGRSIRSWEWIFWVPLMLILGILMFGFSSYYIDYMVFGLSWAFIQIVPVFVIPSWINIAHASSGKLDESLRSVPLTPSGILLPRISAVLLSAMQMFIPATVIVLMLIHKVLSQTGITGGDIIFGAVQILGWIIFLTMWGFAAASIIARRGGNFFLWYFAPGVILILVVIPLLIGQIIPLEHEMFFPDQSVFGILYSGISITGLIASPFIYIFACRKWGERTG